MKKVIIVASHLRVGGVAKALIELLKCICEKYDVTLLCFDYEGQFVKDIPSNVTLLPENKYLALTENGFFNLKKYGFSIMLLRILFSGWTKIFGKKYPAKYITTKVGQLKNEYDLAIAFGHPMPDKMFCNITSEITLKCIKAKKKSIVIHCDYGAYGGCSKYNNELIKKFDVITGVSQSVINEVKKFIPELKNTDTLHNCHDFNGIRELADSNPVQYNKNKFIIVSVARLSSEKGLIESIPEIMKVYNRGIRLEWHIIGNGPLYNELLEEIKANNIEKYVYLEGEQTNPYRYMRNADLLFVPSKHEAAPMVFDEAASLGIPVLSSKTLSALEMVKARSIGDVYDSKKDSLEDILIETIKNNNEKKYQVRNLFVSNNNLAIEDFERLISND